MPARRSFCTAGWSLSYNRDAVLRVTECSKEDFLQWARKKRVDGEAQETFDTLDLDNSESISLVEFREFMTNIGDASWLKRRQQTTQAARRLFIRWDIPNLSHPPHSILPIYPWVTVETQRAVHC
jgi:hypothetical protein